jgi:cytidylate kinase
MGEHIVVAIDGPAGAGKSTVARSVASRLGFLYVDTGAMYRAVALWALRRNIDTSDMHRLEQLARESDIDFESETQRVLLNGEDVTEAIRAPDVTAASSQVAAVPAVRRALVDKQRRLAQQANVVMEGRDIGSNVFPEAKVKVFLDAPADVRAVRRARELSGRGVRVDAAVTGRDMEARDQRDRTRAEAPLLQAPDAIYVDTAGLDEEQVAEAVLKIVRDRTTNGKEYAG